MTEDNRIKVLKWWLDRGFSLLPCKPYSKNLLYGYGPHRDKITTVERAAEMFRNRRLNIAVCGHDKTIILDFDNADVYAEWREKHNDLAKTYTEKTPRGGTHVFFNGVMPGQIQLVEGVELKRVCVVSPSMINSKTYTRGEGEILGADPENIFSSITKPGTRSAYVLSIEHKKRVAGPMSLIEHIKRNNSIEHVYTVYRPEVTIHGESRYVMVLCPFHDDSKPSMFLDRERQIFGCHACGVHGDVINLYARFEGIDNREAVARLSRALQGVGK